MVWTEEATALSYDIYRKIIGTGPPSDAGTCFRHDVADNSTLFQAPPQTGDVWLLQVTGNYVSGDGPLGVGTACSARTPAQNCP